MNGQRKMGEEKEGGELQVERKQIEQLMGSYPVLLASLLALEAGLVVGKTFGAILRTYL